MKKFLKSTLIVLAIVSILVNLVSCGNGNIKYNEYGFFYELPKDMDKKTVAYAAILHSNSEATFMVSYYDEEGLTENEIDPDIKINRYADKFLIMNGYDDTTYNYDEENRKVDFFVEVTFDEGEENEETILRYHVLLRNDFVVYIVTMYCDISLAEKYRPIFSEWGSYIYVQN